MPPSFDFDVGIIGAGPAGSSMAAYLARAGVRCAVFEKEIFPRPHVGESLVPSSTRVFRELDFLHKMEEAGFPHKYGAVWTASGRRTLLGNQLKWRIRDEVFDQYALHTWFDDFDRLATVPRPSLRDYIFVHFLPITNSWVWQIPITETITSVGVVTQRKHFAAQRASREQFFWDCVMTRPELYEGLRAARQVRPLREEGDYSYAMRQITADRLLFIGDAARFVDPIFSTGVSIALNCARFASKDVVAALEHGNFGRRAFANYEETIRRGTGNWYNFISVYYRLNVLFTAFIQDPRYRLDVLQLLQGDVYDDEEPPVLARMRHIVANVEQNPGHVWHKLLGDLTASAFAPQGEAMTM